MRGILRYMFVGALVFLMFSDYACPVYSYPFQYSMTLHNGARAFGRALSDYKGDLLVGSLSSAYLFDIHTGELIQEYLNAGGFLNGTDWITAFGDKIAVGSAIGNGSVSVFDATSGAPLRSYVGSEVGDAFGWTLASNGDHLFIGAPEQRQGFTFYGHGKVEIVDELDNRSTVLNPEPGPSIGLASETFGYDVEVVNNDLYVGSPLDEEGGKVWHIDAITGVINREYKNPDGNLGNGGKPRFGSSLAVSDEYLLVGANQSSASGINASGAAYLFDRASGDLIHKFFDPNPTVLDNFGFNVEIVDKYALIGAHADGPRNEGAVFVFDMVSGGLLQTIYSPTLSPSFFGLELSSIGSGFFAISEPTDNGIIHIYSLIPEPASASLFCVGLMMFLAGKNRSISNRHKLILPAFSE